MAFTYPVVEQIAQLLVNRVKNVTTINCYQLDLIDVMRPTRQGSNTASGHLTVVIEQGDPARDTESDYAGNIDAICWRQPFIIQCMAAPREGDKIPQDQYLNVMTAEVIKAICTPESGSTDWAFFGTLAIGAEWGDPVLILSQTGATDGVALVLEVIYRVDADDPYTAR